MHRISWRLHNNAETDAYAAARVFTGWNLATSGNLGDVTAGYYQFQYNANQHDTTQKNFTFAIYRDGGRSILARAATDGMQDGIDFITALATHPETAKRLARKLWSFFITEAAPPDPAFVDAVANVYLQNNTEMQPVLR